MLAAYTVCASANIPVVYLGDKRRESAELETRSLDIVQRSLMIPKATEPSVLLENSTAPS